MHLCLFCKPIYNKSVGFSRQEMIKSGLILPASAKQQWVFLGISHPSADQDRSCLASVSGFHLLSNPDKLKIMLSTTNYFISNKMALYALDARKIRANEAYN